MATVNKKAIIVEVKNLKDLNKALEQFSPLKGTTIRKTLLDGFDVVKKHMEFNALQKAIIDKAISQSPDKFLKKTLPNPATSAGYNVDLLIRDRLNGKREGLVIKWNLPEGVFEYEPYSGQLKKL